MKKRTRRPRTFRPLLEQFESRCLMSVTAVADSVSTHFGAPTIDVLANDLGSSLSIVSYTQGVYGAVTQVGTELKYTTNAGVSATADSFWYTIHDSTGASASASVTIEFTNALPTAEAFTAAAVHPGAAVSTKVIADGTDPGLDTDPDGDTVTVQSLGSASYGTVSINGDGTIKYTANTGTSATLDSFTYTINDGHGGTASASITVPIMQTKASSDSASAHAAAVDIAVLANDSVFAGYSSYPAATKQIFSYTQGAHGTVTLNNSGTPSDPTDDKLTYTPNGPTSATTDSFSYVLSDGDGGSASAAVTIYFDNSAPIAVNDTASAHGASVSIAVLENDSDPDGDALTVQSVGSASFGSVSIGAGGNVVYSPYSNVSASVDAFSYAIADGYGATSTATVTVEIKDTVTIGFLTYELSSDDSVADMFSPDVVPAAALPKIDLSVYIAGTSPNESIPTGNVVFTAVVGGVTETLGTASVDDTGHAKLSDVDSGLLTTGVSITASYAGDQYYVSTVANDGGADATAVNADPSVTDNPTITSSSSNLRVVVVCGSNGAETEEWVDSARSFYGSSAIIISTVHSLADLNTALSIFPVGSISTLVFGGHGSVDGVQLGTPGVASTRFNYSNLSTTTDGQALTTTIQDAMQAGGRISLQACSCAATGNDLQRLADLLNVQIVASTISITDWGTGSPSIFNPS